MKTKLFFTFASLLASVSALAQPQLGKDSVDDVIAAMTLEEKVEMLHGSRMRMAEPKFPGAAGFTTAIPRLGIPSVHMADGPHRLVISPSRAFDSNVYNTTEIPSELTIASSFDTDAAFKAGELIGQEVSDYGLDVLLAPGVNLIRNTLGGRNGEYYSEDPVHAGLMASAFVNGIQSRNVGVALKHYAVNNQETNRNANDAIVSQRALRELYLRNFEIAVKRGDPWSVMTSYNKVNGEYVCESRFFCEDVLRSEWGYKGLVMSDWNAGRDAVKSIAAGNDLLMPGQDKQREAILEAARNGTLPMEYIDLSVKRVLEFVLKSNSFKNFDYPNETDLKAHSKIAREIAANSLVLLKNDNDALPMTDVRNVALYGTTSYDIIPAGMGFGATGHGYYCVSLVEGLRKAGYDVEKSLIGPYQAHIAAENKKNYPNGMPPFSITAPTRADEFVPTAETLAANAAANDMAIITLGRANGEGADRRKEHFYLSEKESELIKVVSGAYHDAGKKVVVLLNIVSAIETASWKDSVDGILCVFQPGCETGNAVADVLSGKVNPSGRLPQTFQVNYGDAACDNDFPCDYVFDMSAFTRAYALSAKDAAESARRQVEPELTKNVDYTTYTEDIYVGYRYFSTFGKKVSYPFGFGLSYTGFDYELVSSSMDERNCSVTVKVTNVGSKAGRDVLQVYVRAPKGRLEKPSRELKAFAKTKTLAPGESQELTLGWETSLNASYNEKKAEWELAKGVYSFLVCKDAESAPLLEVSRKLR